MNEFIIFLLYIYIIMTSKRFFKSKKRSRIKRSRIKRSRIKRSRIKRSRIKRSRIKRSQRKRRRKKGGSLGAKGSQTRASEGKGSSEKARFIRSKLSQQEKQLRRKLSPHEVKKYNIHYSEEYDREELEKQRKLQRQRDIDDLKKKMDVSRELEQVRKNKQYEVDLSNPKRLVRTTSSQGILEQKYQMILQRFSEENYKMAIELIREIIPHIERYLNRLHIDDLYKILEEELEFTRGEIDDEILNHRILEDGWIKDHPNPNPDDDDDDDDDDLGYYNENTKEWQRGIEESQLTPEKISMRRGVMNQLILNYKYEIYPLYRECLINFKEKLIMNVQLILASPSPPILLQSSVTTSSPTEDERREKILEIKNHLRELEYYESLIEDEDIQTYIERLNELKVHLSKSPPPPPPPPPPSPSPQSPPVIDCNPERNEEIIRIKQKFKVGTKIKIKSQIVTITGIPSEGECLWTFQYSKDKKKYTIDLSKLSTWDLHYLPDWVDKYKHNLSYHIRQQIDKKIYEEIIDFIKSGLIQEGISFDDFIIIIEQRKSSLHKFTIGKFDYDMFHRFLIGLQNQYLQDHSVGGGGGRSTSSGPPEFGR